MTFMCRCDAVYLWVHSYVNRLVLQFLKDQFLVQSCVGVSQETVLGPFLC